MVEDVRTLVDEFLLRTDAIFGPRYAAVLYGSAARGDWHRDRSDINLLLVAEELTPVALRALGPVLSGLPESWRSPPLLFTRAEWVRATDVYPVELTDMLLHREVLRGQDPVAAMQPHPTQLRAALERELRTKVVRLRQGYALRAGDPDALGAFATGTLGTVLVLARATLVLLGRPVPAEAAAVLRAFAEVTGGEPDPLLVLAARRDTLSWPCPLELFEAYLGTIAAAAAYLDHHLPGAS